jgi:hypothetical protein
MILIGDIHGKVGRYKALLNKLKYRFPGESSIQLGDFGIGFPELRRDGKAKIPYVVEQAPVLPGGSWFFRGNHDNPAVCRTSPNYLGDFGYRQFDGLYNAFFAGGAWSTDGDWRVQGVSWWPDEQLTSSQMNEAFDLYVKVKPELVLTHDCPLIAAESLMSRHSKTRGGRTSTAVFLNALYEEHQPAQWFFGHWHVDWRRKIGRTQFRCLPELAWTRV